MILTIRPVGQNHEMEMLLDTLAERYENLNVEHQDERVTITIPEDAMDAGDMDAIMSLIAAASCEVVGVSDT